MIANRRVSKCRVRIAHATFRLRMKRVRSAHPTTVRTPSCSPRPVASLGLPGHSRDGGNPAWPWATPSFANDTGSPSPIRSRTGRVKWQTAFADIPREGLSMRLSRHALPRRGGLPGGLRGGLGPGPAKWEMAAGEASKKFRVDLAWDKSKSCQGLGGWPTGWPRARATCGAP